MKPLILVTNDDGVDSPGLMAAVRVAAACGDVLVTAPFHQQTAMSRGYPRTKDLGIIEEFTIDLDEKTIPAYGIHGSPSYSVAYGVMEIAGRQPDLVISGVNHGANLGKTVTCSGTIGACLEADSQGIPAIALSLETDMSQVFNSRAQANDFDSIVETGIYWTQKVLSEGMPMGCSILNINAPSCPAKVEQQRITRLDPQDYYTMIPAEKGRDWSTPYTMPFIIGFDEDRLLPDGDIRAVCVDRIISVTPMGWDLSCL